ncbi:hypothetical protein [Streptomyces sp. PsTaAH-124]|uniref:hypothetical protein n=1 Tax=Streptomyces sp. PsTaAH-124 TaxID=1157638 RepID=UPI00039AA94F|nr:hypothetical protein [Streptomyces sp. PsTaAH-124]
MSGPSTFAAWAAMEGSSEKHTPEHGPGDADAEHGEGEAAPDLLGHLRARDARGRGTGRGVRFAHHRQEDEQDEADPLSAERGRPRARPPATKHVSDDEARIG